MWGKGERRRRGGGEGFLQLSLHKSIHCTIEFHLLVGTTGKITKKVKRIEEE